MNSSIEIVKLTPEEWEKYKNLRLRGLKEDSYAFLASYEEEVDYPDERWKENLGGSLSKKGFCLLFAKEGDNLIGMVGIRRPLRKKGRHVANIGPMYVAKEARGKGIGSFIMQAALDEIKKDGGILKVSLGVNTTNIPALKLYEKMGFKIVGTLEKQLNIDGVYYDEYIMDKFVSSTTGS